MATSTTSRSVNLPSSALVEQDDGDFVGTLFDTILYERACYRLHTLNRYDFPLRYDELAHDFLTAYRLCLEPKFLANQNTADFAQRILQSKLLTAKGVRAFVQEHGGFHEIFPTDDDTDFLGGAKDVEELAEDELSDYDEVDRGMRTVRKNVGYRGPTLKQRQRQQVEEGQAHREAFASQYFMIWKHSQDMIAAIIAHLRRRVWYHDGSGGEVIDIQNMGVDGKGKRTLTKKTEKDSKSAGRPNKNDNRGIQEEGNEDEEDLGVGEGNSTEVQEIKGVKGVKKYTRRFNGKQKRRNYERALARSTTQNGFWQVTNVHERDPPTDYSDSDTEDRTSKTTAGAESIDVAIERLAAMAIEEYTGSAKRPIHWLQAVKSERLYDWQGLNKDLRLIDLPVEDEDPTFYGRLTRDILIKYKVTSK